MDNRLEKICILGAGNLAWSLAQALYRAGHTISCVYSRTEKPAQELAELVDSRWTTNLNDAGAQADLIIVALADNAVIKAVEAVNPEDSLIVHTAGSIPVDIFRNKASGYGVFYPLQTFSKKNLVDFSDIPVCLEANSEINLERLEKLACTITGRVHRIDSRQREYLHLAAVFACNFSNHMYHIAEKLMEEKGVPFDIIHPLINETSGKATRISPFEAQTGPAVRNDQNIMEKHMDLLSSMPGRQHLYKLITEHIRKCHGEKGGRRHK